MSGDCSKVVFSSRHHYTGVPGTGKERLYEWSQASGLRYAGFIPDGAGGEAAVEATGGSAVAGLRGTASTRSPATARGSSSRPNG